MRPALRAARRLLGVAFALTTLASASVVTAPCARADDAVTYVPEYRDPVLLELEQKAEAARAALAEATKKIREAQQARRDAEAKERRTLRFDMKGIVRPEGPAAFRQAFHFPPVPQYRTNTCWSFSGSSFFESEIMRLTGRQVRLSEMYTVYWEYLDKLRRFVAERGDSALGEGSQANTLSRSWALHGIVPLEAYPGFTAGDGRHDHAQLFDRIARLADFVRQNELWDEEMVIDLARVILDRTLGRPPESFTWNGRTYTPQSFLAEVARLVPGDYVVFQSTLRAPFWQHTLLDFPDNWWRDAGYVNLPLDDWYRTMRDAIDAGYTVAVGGDVSEPGMNGFEDAAVVPSFDIPQQAIDQDSRELRIQNGTTGDDHGTHIVGIAQAGGHEWFLVKDSNRSSRWGRFAGYYFYRDDYVRLKMLSFMVHKDAAQAVLARVTR